MLNRRDTLSYGALRAPLAWLELPLFVLLPAYYAQSLGLSLTGVGLTLLVARLIDAAADPWIGALLDRGTAPTRWRRAIWLALPSLALGYAALFFPAPGVPPLLWLGASAVCTYLAYSVVSIAYLAWGTQLGASTAERVRLSSTREGFGLAGVLLSAAFLVSDRVPALVLGFTLLATGAAWALRAAPLPSAPPRSGPAEHPEPTRWSTLWHHRPTRRLLSIFLANGLANAIPATLILFFVSDVLQAAHHAPLFLFVYFLAAALGLPSWTRLARRLGLPRAWALGMVVALSALLGAALLGPGDSAAFLLISLITGWALGADLALPSALLATILAEPDAPQQRAGSVLGLWNLATKLNLALAAGLALPALRWLGYAPNQPNPQISALSAVYALLPCLFKLLATGALLWPPLPTGKALASPQPRTSQREPPHD